MDKKYNIYVLLSTYTFFQRQLINYECCAFLISSNQIFLFKKTSILLTELCYYKIRYKFIGNGFRLNNYTKSIEIEMLYSNVQILTK